MRKTCTKCNEEKDIEEYYLRRKDEKYVNSICKSCCSKISKEYIKNKTDEDRKKDNDRNRKSYDDRAKQVKKEYQEKNKERISDYQKEYVKKNKEKRSNQIKEYYLNNNDKKEKLKEQRKVCAIEKMKEKDSLYVLRVKIRKTISQSFKRNGYTKNSHTQEILGCTFEYFKVYIESKFETWMTWENKGLYDGKTLNYGWDIDHIIPVSSATTEEEIIKLNHYTNLQPLCGYYNRHIKFNNC